MDRKLLTNRSTSVTIERCTSENLAVNAGIPQGSPISPILFLFFNAPLIEECASSGLKIQVAGFMDNIHFIVYETSTEANCRILERAHKICPIRMSLLKLIVHVPLHLANGPLRCLIPTVFAITAGLLTMYIVASVKCARTI